MYEWKMNDAVTINLPECTEEALEKLLEDPMASVFLPYDSKDIIRKKFKEHLEELKKNGKKTETVHNNNK